MEIAAVNALLYEDFVKIFGNVVEHCPIVTAAVWSMRPFGSLDAFEAAIGDFIDALPESGEPLSFSIVYRIARVHKQSRCVSRQRGDTQVSSRPGWQGPPDRIIDPGVTGGASRSWDGYPDLHRSFSHGPAQHGVQGALWIPICHLR